MITRFSFVIPGTDGKDILADLTYNADSSTFNSSLPVVVFSHGFKGFKDWGHFNVMADNFAQAGFAFLKFNFSHNGGTIGNPIDFPDLEAFSKNNFIKELNDLKQVFDTLDGKIVPVNRMREFASFRKLISSKKIYLIAHSRGGGISTIFASTDNRVKKIGLWNAVSDFYNRLPCKADLQEWKLTGCIFIENKRTQQQMPMNYEFVEVMLANKELLSIEKACRKLTIPAIVVQAEKDQVVKKEEGDALHRWLKNSDYFVVSESDHVFGSSHPFQGQNLPGETAQVIKKTISFFKEN